MQQQQQQQQQGADNCLRNVIANFLPPEWTEADLQKHFKSFGEIEQIKLVREKGTQNSKCFGFVVFNTAEAAHAAIQASNGMSVSGKRLKVALANPPNGHKNVNVYVCGVKKGVQANEIRDIFAAYGNIENVNVLEQSRKGEAFIRYTTEDEAERAINALNGKPLVRAADGAVLCESAIVKYANRAKSKASKQRQQEQAGAQQAPGFAQGGGQVWNPYGQASMAGANSGYPTPAPTSVFVYNIPSSVDDQMLYLLFSMYGSIQSMNIMKNVDGTCKGYGFVNYWHYYEAVNAITNLNGFHLMNKVLQVRFKDPQKQRPQGH